MISIRRFTSQDFDLVQEFYERAFDGDVQRKMSAFKWIQTRNPFADSERNYILIFSDEKLVGYFGLMPIRVYESGKPFMALFGQEVLIHPSHRGMGLAKKLLVEINLSNQLLIGLWLNEKILALIQGGGWSRIGHYGVLRKVYNVEALIKLKVKNVYLRRLLTGGAKAWFRRGSSEDAENKGYAVEIMEKCGVEFDRFFSDVASRFGMICDRNSAVLNWRYLDIPYKKYTFLAARKNGKISGFAVLRIEDQIGPIRIRKGIIVDILAHPDEPEAVEVLAKRSEQIFVKERVDFSVVLVLPEGFRAVFRKLGYRAVRGRRTDSLLINHENLIPNSGVVKDMRNWYLTFGDSDSDLW